MAKSGKTVVLYHKGCRDGFGAAWSAWRKFGQKAEYIGVNHDEPLPVNLYGKDVYLLDFSYPQEMMKNLLKKAKSVTALDHHISAEKSTKLALNYVYDIKRSGSTIAWGYFFPREKIPVLLRYIEDVDIWNLKLPNTLALIASLETYEPDFHLWNKLAKDWESGAKRKKYLEEGRAILKYQDALVKKAIKEAEEVRFMGHKALAVNFSLAINSEIGEAMRRKGYHLGIIWQRRGGKLIVSLRSAGEVDASKIASRFGGGGHKKAAAFRLPSKEKFPWTKAKN